MVCLFGKFFLRAARKNPRLSRGQRLVYAISDPLTGKIAVISDLKKNYIKDANKKSNSL